MSSHPYHLPYETFPIQSYSARLSRRILPLAHRLSKQTGESVDQAVSVALQERLEREQEFDPAIRPFVRPELVAAARLAASSLRSRGNRSKTEGILLHPVTGETLDAIV